MTNRCQIEVLRRGADAWNTWRNANLAEPINLAGADLSGIDAHGVDLSQANLTDCNFSASDFRGADLSHATLQGANFSGAKMASVVLADAFLVNANFEGASLYDKISREDILAHAWAQCRSNKGAPGVDGQDFADVAAYGVQRWLGELALALREETYRPDPIRRVFIPKANGKLRPLGISTLRDRVCMTAAMLVLEPIFEADLPPEQYAYRPGRNAQQAAIEVGETLFRGHPEVVDADLADYFGSIPHAELMLSLARRIVDGRVLHLIKMWLECTVEETDYRGRKTRTTEAKDQRRGIPQGSPISPLLANLYMRRFVLGWKKLGLEQSLGTRIVTYADDLVILCRKGKAERAAAPLVTSDDASGVQAGVEALRAARAVVGFRHRRRRREHGDSGVGRYARRRSGTAGCQPARCATTAGSCEWRARRRAAVPHRGHARPVGGAGSGVGAGRRLSLVCTRRGPGHGRGDQDGKCLEE